MQLFQGSTKEQTSKYINTRVRLFGRKWWKTELFVDVSAPSASKWQEIQLFRIAVNLDSPNGLSK